MIYSVPVLRDIPNDALAKIADVLEEVYIHFYFYSIFIICLKVLMKGVLKKDVFFI